MNTLTLDVTVTNLNSAGATKSLAAGIEGRAQGLEDADLHRLSGKAIVNLQQQIDAPRKASLEFSPDDFEGLVNDVINPPGEFTLTAASTTIAAPPFAVVQGQSFYLFITIDATDGRQIVWGAGFKGVTVDDIDNRAGKVNAYTFVGRADGNWWCVGTRLGMDP